MMKIPMAKGMADVTFGPVRSRLPWWKKLFHKHELVTKEAKDHSWASVSCWCGAGQSWQG